MVSGDQTTMSAKRWTRWIYLALFIAYMVALLFITVIRPGVYDSNRQINPRLFVELFALIKTSGWGTFLWLFLGNIGWFVPFGFLVPILFKRLRPATVVLAGLLLSLCIETTQFIFHKGVAELDDLVLNTLGVAIGYLLFRLVHGLRRHTSRFVRKRRLRNK